MILDETYNTDDLPESNYDPLPAGWYSATISEAEIKDTKQGNGKYISARFKIDGPTHEGRIVFLMLNIRNANPKAEEIGRRQLGDLLRALGIKTLSDTDQLLGKSCAIKLAIEDKQDGYEAKNTIKAYKSLDSEAPKKEAPAKSQPPASNAQKENQGTRKAAPPWARKKNDEAPF